MHWVKTGIPENYRSTIPIVPPPSQYYPNIHVAYCNRIPVVKISAIVIPTWYTLFPQFLPVVQYLEIPCIKDDKHYLGE